MNTEMDFISEKLVLFKEVVFNQKEWSSFKPTEKKTKSDNKCPIEVNFPDKSLEGHLYLKHHLFVELENKFNNGEIELLRKDCAWIINDWGQIKLDLTKSENIKILNNFLESIYKKDSNRKIFIEKEEYRIISSLSKVASFCKPEDYAIYDSRAILSLNWLKIKYARNEKKIKIFPQPSGGSNIVKNYNLKSLCYLANYDVEEYKQEDKYQAYCDLLKEISKKIYINLDDKIKERFKDWPYLAEMFLFLYSDSKVGKLEKEIMKSINVNFNV